jgi:hypothetical protein
VITWGIGGATWPLGAAPQPPTGEAMSCRGEGGEEGDIGCGIQGLSEGSTIPDPCRGVRQATGVGGRK